MGILGAHLGIAVRLYATQRIKIAKRHIAAIAILVMLQAGFDFLVLSQVTFSVHLLGALLGFPLGIALLPKNTVETSATPPL